MAYIACYMMIHSLHNRYLNLEASPKLEHIQTYNNLQVNKYTSKVSTTAARNGGKVGDRVCTQHRRPIVDTVLLCADVYILYIYIYRYGCIHICYIYVLKQKHEAL